MSQRKDAYQNTETLTDCALSLAIGDSWLSLQTDSFGQAIALLRHWEQEFQQWATLTGRELRLMLPDGKYYSLAPSLVGSGGTIQNVSPGALASLRLNPCIPINHTMLALFERFLESDRPMFLLANQDGNGYKKDAQLMVNQAAADIMESSTEAMISKNMQNYWNAADLSGLHNMVRAGEQPFSYRYRAIQNDIPDAESGLPVWFEATNRYELLHYQGKSFRLSTTQDFKVLGVRRELTVRGAR